MSAPAALRKTTAKATDVTKAQTVIESGQAILREVIAAMCHNRDLLKVDFYDDDTSIRIVIEAHATDSRILVGSCGAHIKNLHNLARLLFWGSGRIVQILPVVTVDGTSSDAYRKFTPKEDWSEAYIIGLLTRIAEAVFSGASVTVVSQEDTTWSQNMRVCLTPGQNPAVAKRLASSLAVLFLPIGTKFGRMVYVTLANGSARASKPTEGRRE